MLLGGGQRRRAQACRQTPFGPAVRELLDEGGTLDAIWLNIATMHVQCTTCICLCVVHCN